MRGKTMSATDTQIGEPAYVVKNRAGQIVVMFWGDSKIAAVEAAGWAERPGYFVERVVVSDTLQATLEENVSESLVASR